MRVGRGICNYMTDRALAQAGYSVCYEKPYAWHTSKTELLTYCSNGYSYFVGAKLSNATGIFMLGAFGTPSIFKDTYSSSYPQQDEAGAYWYMVDGKGFGFSSSPTINLRACDDIKSKGCGSRLCWHIDGYSGGYRAGCQVALNNDVGWMKVIYYIPKPTSLSTSSTSSLSTTLISVIVICAFLITCFIAISILYYYRNRNQAVDGIRSASARPEQANVLESTSNILAN